MCSRATAKDARSTAEGTCDLTMSSIFSVGEHGERAGGKRIKRNGVYDSFEHVGTERAS